MNYTIGYSDNDKHLALINITEHSSISDYFYEKSRKIDNYIDEFVHKQGCSQGLLSVNVYSTNIIFQHY